MASGRTPVVIAIAGSDSGGGAGIQADLKALAAIGVHGTTAITAITAQNTVGVTAIHPIPPDVIVAQIEAVAADIGIDAIKVGMLGTREAARAVAGAIAALPAVPVVVDPVMVSESGATLLDDESRAALIERILPLATVVTPNVPEARVLAGSMAGADEDSPAGLARRIRSLGPEAVIVTGGHADGTDVLDDGDTQTSIAGPLHRDGAAHGSGCTHSSTLAGLLALGWPLESAARAARRAAGEAIAHGLRDIGDGAGPVDALDITSRRPAAPLT